MNIKNQQFNRFVRHVCSILVSVFAVIVLVTVAYGQPPEVVSTLWDQDQDQQVIQLQHCKGMLFTDAVLINGKRVGYFLIDTGSTKTIVDSSVVRGLDIAETGKLNRMTPVTFYRINQLTWGPVKLPKHIVVSKKNILPIKTQKAFSNQVVGILGMDVLGQTPFTLDFSVPSITIHNPARFVPPQKASRHRLELVGWHPTPDDDTWPSRSTAVQVATKCQLNDSACYLIIDTGSNGTITFWPSIVSRMTDLVIKDRANSRTVVTLGGIGERRRMTKVKQCKLLGQNWTDIDAWIGSFLPRIGHNEKMTDGIIGTGILLSYRLTINIKNRSLWSEYGAYPTLAKRLASGDIDIVKKNFLGESLLAVAANKGNLGEFQLLLNKGASLADRTNLGDTILHCAARGGNDRIVALVLKHLRETKTTIEHRNNAGLTALLLAVSGNHVQATKRLLEVNAQVDNSAQSGKTPLYCAATEGNVAMAKLLISHGAKVNPHTRAGLTPIIGAITTGNAKIYRLFRDLGAMPPSKMSGGVSILHVAANGGSVPITKDILALFPEMKIDLRTSDTDLTPLMVAAQNGHLDVARVLVDAGADIRAISRKKLNAQPIHFAVKKGNSFFVEFLLERGVNVDARMGSDLTPLLIASSYGDLNAVKLLIAKGASLRAVDKKSTSVLHYAVSYEHKNIVEVLVKNAPFLCDLPRQDGVRPIHLAASSGNALIIETLIRAGANVSLADAQKRQAIHYAARTRYAEAIQVLIKGGADVNASSKLGMTPLHYACHLGNANSVRVLLVSGASPDVTNANGLKPIDLARKARHMNIVKILGR